MTGKVFSFDLAEPPAPRLGLIALQADETIEGDLRRLLPAQTEFMVSRVSSAEEVTSDTLAAMEGHLGRAASLFPVGSRFDVMGYGCTSGTAQIGAAAVAERIRTSVAARSVTEPLSGLIAASAHLGLRRLALLSPYVAQVSERLRHVLAGAGVETPVFGSFDVGNEATVVRITASSIAAAARELMRDADVDGLFLSCTNLRALDVIAPLEAEIGKPVMSSNQVLAWHMMRLAGMEAPAHAPGRLLAA